MSKWKPFTIRGSKNLLFFLYFQWRFHLFRILSLPWRTLLFCLEWILLSGSGIRWKKSSIFAKILGYVFFKVYFFLFWSNLSTISFAYKWRRTYKKVAVIILLTSLFALFLLHILVITVTQILLKLVNCIYW